MRPIRGCSLYAGKYSIESREKSKDEVLHNAVMAVYGLAKEEMVNKKFPSLLKILEMLALER